MIVFEDECFRCHPGPFRRDQVLTGGELQKKQALLKTGIRQVA